jgi:hypothetical protein
MKPVTLLAAAIICMLAIIVPFSCRITTANKNKPLNTFLADLAPGMTVEHVRALIPSHMLVNAGPTTNARIMSNTVLYQENAHVQSYLEYYYDPPSWRLWGNTEMCYLYFDARDRLVGISYYSPRYKFNPSDLTQWQDPKR